MADHIVRGGNIYETGFIIRKRLPELTSFKATKKAL
jgi:hypothetical protein